MAADRATVGAEFTGARKRVSEVRLRAFSGGAFDSAVWPARNIHTDLSAAKGVGVAAPVASGAQTQGYLIELMITLFGIEWLNGNRMKVTFTAPVHPGDMVVPKAAVKSKHIEKDGVRLEFDVWLENQRGEKVVVGETSGWLRLDV